MYFVQWKQKKDRSGQEGGHILCISQTNNCEIISPICATDRMKLGLMSKCLGMSCFEIVHTHHTHTQLIYLYW